MGSEGGALLLERAEELAAVDTVLTAARSGAGSVLLFDGPAGIGKSALVARARQHADNELTVVAARGTELETPFQFGVVRQLFEPMLARTDERRREALFGGTATHARSLFDTGTAPTPATDENAVFAVLHGLYWLALNLSEERPLLIAVDDLQWADAPSARWLAYLARRLEGTAIALVGSVRPIENEDAAVAELLTDPEATVIRPKPLSVAATTELVRATFNNADDEFCVACHRASAGNPLLLNELLRSVAVEAIEPIGGSVAAVERLAPDAVSRSVRRRLGELSPEASRLAQAIATLGDDVRGEHAAALAELEQRELAPAAAALARADLIASDPPLRFVHPLVRNAVYGLVPAHERAQAHAAAAKLLAAGRVPEHRVAAQLLYAPPGSVDGAVSILAEAGRRAGVEGAPESVSRYLRRALDEDLAANERGELLLELGRAEVAVGAPSFLDDLKEAARLLEEPRARITALAVLGDALYWAGREEEGVVVLVDALRGLTDDLGDLRVPLESALIVNESRLDSRYLEARERLADLHASGLDTPLLQAIRAYTIGAAGGDCDEAAATALRALEAMDDDELARNYTTAIYALLHTDRLDEALPFLDRAIAHVRRRSAVFQFSSLSMTRAIIQYARGHLVDAEADGRAALAALPHRQAWFVPHAHAWLAQILVERGATGEAAQLAAAVGIDGSIAFTRTPGLRARALIASASGDHADALRAALELGENLTAFGHTNPAVSYPGWRSLAAAEHFALGDRDAALALAHEEVDLARQWGASRTLGRALRVLGTVSGGDETLDLLREAVAVLDGSPAKLEYAYALTDLGAALRRGNQRADARDPLREAADLAQRLGAIGLAERAHEELVATGARPRRLVARGADSLTPSERRVAALAADGMTNREIAQALFVTLRTVEMHLSNAFRKLEISARTQLTSALASQPATG